ncbi:hypothetical protein BP6252_00477 [Coleophoma cylindrospora]|uniref:C2H2-type domain-containing protein n=1 Tax=Coleophoma cylindrospora TaxID=1849047 RepID=A0A3D8SQ60_9HELO|nr:hypothetical protein BP6252_00477 [Coleophoma cylindrospora]
MKRQGELVDQHEWCDICKVMCKDFPAFHLHKLQSKQHVCCSVCARDFVTRDGLNKHYNLMHAAQQNLECPGCHENFTRVGGLINHIEHKLCPVIDAERFEQERLRKQDWHENYENARTFAEYGPGYEDLADENRAAAIAIRNPNHVLTGVKFPDIWTEASGDRDGGARLNLREDNDDDLLVFESPKRRDGWVEEEPVSKLKPAPKFNLPRGNSVQTRGFDKVESFSPFTKPMPDDIFETANVIDASMSKQITENNATPADKPNVLSPYVPGPWGTHNDAASFHGPEFDKGWASLQNSNVQKPALAVSSNKPVSLTVTSSSSWDTQQTTPIDPIQALATNAWNNTEVPVTALDLNPSTTSTVSTQLLFPEKDGVVPPADLLALLTPTPQVPKEPGNDLERMEHDPDNPKFNINKYWVSFIRKYKCPHMGCRKSVESSKGFISHLKSPAHMNEKLRCKGCLRYFASATALTQHSESQGVRCNVRNTDNYNAIVDEVTAGTTATAGRHEDDTVRYVTNPNAAIAGIRGGKALLNANRDANAAADARFYSYWDNKQIEW